MAAKRTKAQREKDLTNIADLYVKGSSMRDIAKIISSRRSYSLSAMQISKDIQLITKDWRKHSAKKIEERKLLEVQKINKVERSAWEQYEKKPAPRWLEVVMKCIEKRCKIFGIEQADELVLQRQIVVVSLPPVEDELPQQEF